MNLIYDVAHNIAKFEEHVVEEVAKKLWVHQGRPARFRRSIPRCRRLSPHRSAGHHSRRHGPRGWVLVGQPGSMEKTFGTTCHGAGRAMSRTRRRERCAGNGPSTRSWKHAASSRAPRAAQPRGGTAQGVQERR